jgi:arylformamidase
MASVLNAPDKALLSRQYNNRELVPEHPQYFARWQQSSALARSRMSSHLDLAYGEKAGDTAGEAAGETLDLFPARKGDGSCLMFIHGGYWRSLDKKDFSFLAPPLVDAGISLAVVNYDLCPKVTLEEIVRQMLRASRWLWLHAEDYGMDQDRLYVGGHSAGGHLAAMMMCAQWPHFDQRLPKDLWKGALAISGVYDLRPLIEVDFLQPDLRLDEALATRLSPALMVPATRCPVMTCVGGDESSEFHRQNAMLGERWRTAFAGDIPMPGTHHFSVVDGLAEQKSALFAGARRLMKLDK